ncbi:MAG: 2-hydroxyacyl-CoA dehydratase family protein [candidate division WOR-3 bacterium]
MAMRIGARLAQLRSARVEELQKLKEGGQKVIGYFCLYAPVELIRAAGAIPVRLMRGGSEAADSGRRFLRADACPFCRACLGNFPSDPVFRLVDAVVAVNTCDMMRRLPEVIGHHLSIPTFQVYLSRTSEPLPHRIDEFRRQLKLLADWLGSFCGSGLTDNSLVEAIVVFNRLRQGLRRLDSLRDADHPPISQSQLLDIAAVAWLLDPNAGAELLSSLLEHLVSAVRPQAVGLRPRLMAGGSIVTEDDRWILETIEERALVVADLWCTGTRWFDSDLIPGDEPLAALARFYFTRTACMCRRPNSGLYQAAHELIRRRRVQGLVFKTLLYCDAWSFEVPRLKAVLGIPVLHLDSDYSTENRQQVRTRIEAFLENL